MMDWQDNKINMDLLYFQVARYIFRLLTHNIYQFKKNIINNRVIISKITFITSSRLCSSQRSYQSQDMQSIAACNQEQELNGKISSKREGMLENARRARDQESEAIYNLKNLSIMHDIVYSRGVLVAHNIQIQRSLSVKKDKPMKLN